MHSPTKRNKAIKLRKEGNSYAFISSKISVSKSTLSEWLKGVPFVPNETIKNNILENNRRIVNISRVDKAMSVKKASEYARKHIKSLSDRDMFIFGLGIYLGEGSKTSNQIRVVNSDPRIIKFSMVWFKKCFGLTDENFRVRIHLYPDNDQKEVTAFWMKVLGLKRESFQPSYVDVRLNKKKDRRGVLPYGTAHLGVASNGNKNFGVLLHRRIIASIDLALEKYARD
jgi:hypothetical protein